MANLRAAQYGQQVQYLVFDVEAVADGELIAKVRYPNEQYSPAEAIRAYRDELIEQRGDGKDFIPAPFMLPISVAVGKVDREFRLLDLVVLDDPDYRPDVITNLFWSGWQHYGRPTFVTFNGRGYDLPVLELAAFRYGLSLPDWFNIHDRSFEQSRNRYNLESHLDLMDFFTNFGAGRMTGGLNLLANLIGKPGKTGIDGSKVQDMYDSGAVEEINDYCRCDVLDTYFVFLRSQVLTGALKLEQEQELVSQTKNWLAERADSSPAYTHYLEHWGDWRAEDENSGEMTSI